MIGTIFMVLVVLFLYFNVYIFIQNQDTSFQDAISQSQQLDADRSMEKVSIASPMQTPTITETGVIVTCSITNNSPFPIKITRLWIKDLSTNSLSETDSSPLPLVFASGQTLPESFTVPLQNAQGPFYLEFVTSRGNLLTVTTTSG
jgi:hypothetical protein